MLCEAGDMVFECAAWDEARFLYAEIFERRTYEQHGITLRCPCGARGGVIVDAGANIGLFALYARAACDGGGLSPPRMLSVEPIAPVFDVLCRNTADHGSITPVHAALGATDRAQVALTHFPACPGESTRYPEERAEMRRVLAREALRAGVAHLRGADDVDADDDDGGDGGGRDGGGRGGGARSEAASCAQLTVSSLLRRHARPTDAVHLLKVDVEGDELDVLLGIEPADWARVCQVAVEVHDVAHPRHEREGEGDGSATVGASLCALAPGRGASGTAHVGVANESNDPWWTGDALACGRSGRLGQVLDVLRSRGGFAHVHVVRQRPQRHGDFLSFVPESLALFVVYASRRRPGPEHACGVQPGGVRPPASP